MHGGVPTIYRVDADPQRGGEGEGQDQQPLITRITSCELERDRRKCGLVVESGPLRFSPRGAQKQETRIRENAGSYYILGL